MVPVGVLKDLLKGVARVVGVELRQLTFGVLEHLGVNGDLSSSTTNSAERLVHEDLGVRQGAPLTGCASGQQELAHGRCHAHRHGRNIIRDPLHSVIDRHSPGDRATWRVDVEVNIGLGILGVE